MAFAPYHNGNRGARAALAGAFNVAYHNTRFEFTVRDDADRATFAADFPHRIFVGPTGDETRVARVLKTVAYVVTDEAADGSPVVEKWSIKAHAEYAA